MTDANQPLPYTDEVETIPADEANDIERVVQAMKLLLSRSQAKSGEFLADVHVKSHGYARGEFRVQPVGDRVDTYLDLVKKLGSNSDAMRLALEETLRAEQVLFDFQVQLRTSEETMPIEDVTIEWPESESPYQTVAQLVLPRQDIAFLRRQGNYQNLAFNVWHALAAHRPLGGINRVRRSAYPVSSAWRRQQSGVTSGAPTSGDENCSQLEQNSCH